MMYFAVLLFSLLPLISFSLHTVQEWEKLFRINLSHQFTNDLKFRQDLDNHAASLKEKNSKWLYLLKFDQSCDFTCQANFRSELTSFNIQHVDFVGDNYAQFHSTHGIADALKLKFSREIDSVVPFPPSAKVADDVPLACSISGDVSLFVKFVPLNDDDIKGLVSIIRTAATELQFRTYRDDIERIVPGDNNIISVTTSCDQMVSVVEFFSLNENVLWVERKYDMYASLRYAVGSTQTNDPDFRVYNLINMTGFGQVVGVADTGMDPDSCFFKDPNYDYPYDVTNTNHRKVIYYDTHIDNEDGVGHGTRVSSCAAGKCLGVDSESFEDHNGGAYNSKIAFFDIGSGTDSKSSLGVPSNLENDLFKVLYDQGSRILSMSWGGSNNAYDSQAQATDNFMWNNPEALVLFAAGNSGDSGLNSVGSPATCKNCVSVGANLNDVDYWFATGQIGSKSNALYNANTLSYFSSRGPSKDARIKPDVTGVGYFVTMAKNIYPPDNSLDYHCDTESDAGTSFATPLVAGHAILIREYFLNGYYFNGTYNSFEGFKPSGALVKAMLIASGQDLLKVMNDLGAEDTSVQTKLGDNHQGYGRVLLNNVLSFTNNTVHGLTLFVKGSSSKVSLNEKPYFVEFTTQGAKHTYTFTAANPPEGETLQPIKIVLAYTDYRGTVNAATALVNDLDLEVELPDGSKRYPLAVNIDNPTTGTSKDRKNNVEVIVIDSPIAGEVYTVTVTCFKLTQSPQPYAIVMRGQTAQPNYVDTSGEPKVGLTQRAKIAIAVMTILACLLICCVYWIGAYNSRAKARRAASAASLAGRL